MYYRQLKKMLLPLLMCGVIGTVSAQAVLKLGDNPYTINSKAVLDVESTSKGFLPPRMTKVQRDAIVSPPAGLQVWCADCNSATEPISGELCVYSGAGWSPITLVTIPRLTTGKKSDANAPVRGSATSATIKGVLVSTFSVAPIEIGIVWREILGSDFATLPFLDENGAATVPVYKTTGSLVTTDGSAIAVTIPTLTSTRPYCFRTYAKSPLGIGYGNPVVFNCAPPAISTPEVTNGNTISPTFAGTLTVNAGTPQSAVTEYGYCSGTTNPPTTVDSKVVLSTAPSLASLNATLNSETFTADPVIDLAVSNYTVIASGSTYFRYYVIASGITTYSSVAIFYPNVAGSAVVSSYSCSAASAGTMTVGTAVSGVTQTITATVGTVGTYSISAIANGITFAGSGTFAGTGAQNVVLTATGTPTATGSSSFVLNTSPVCNFSRVTNSGTSNGSAVVSSYSCSAASAGTLTEGTVVSGVTQTITATVGTAGTYSISAIANGITFSGSGTFAGTGAQNVVLTATGTPTAAGSSSFLLNTSPVCNFSRVTNSGTSNGSAVVSSYSCSVASAGTMTAGTAVSGVTQTITATVGTAGTYSISAIANGITFAGSGTFAGTGAQNVVLTATGTPTAAETSNFVLNTTPNCSFSRIILAAPVSPVGGNAICDGSLPTTVVPITSSTGKIWMDRNLGASRAATSVTDYEAYGGLYQWGRGNDGHASITWTSSTAGSAVNGTTATLATTDSPGNTLFITNGVSPYDWRSTKNDNLWQGVAGVNNPCPAGYRLPTSAEFTAELTAYSITNSTSAYASSHKFVVAGSRDGSTGALSRMGAVGYYWSGTVSGTDASYRSLTNASATSFAGRRTSGISVRCLKD
jgi:uncharacterized protein (TIGR02145 family)